MNLGTAILICLVVAFVVYKNIQKVSNDGKEFEDIKSDDKEDTSSDFDKFSKFALFVQMEIEKLQDKVEEKSSFYILKDESTKEVFITTTGELLSKIAVLNSSYLANKPKDELEERMFAILSSFDEIIEQYFINSQKLSDRYRETFATEHNRVGL